MEYKRTYNFFRNLIGTPFIWSVLIPLVLLDIVIEIYHRICFPLYHLPIVRRSTYIKFDRYKLPYLKWWEKMGCLYCDYANGLLRYSTAIASETEKYWCSIRHEKDPNYIEPEHHKYFIEYGDEKSYRLLEENYQRLQEEEYEKKKKK